MDDIDIGLYGYDGMAEAENSSPTGNGFNEPALISHIPHEILASASQKLPVPPQSSTSTRLRTHKGNSSPFDDIESSNRSAR